MNLSGERPRRAFAIAACFLAGIFLLWSGWSLWSLRSPAGEPGGRKLCSNELAAFQRLKSIAAAQQRYRSADWDGDGHRTYAAFLAHLWTTLDANGDPVRIELLPRNLAFAMETPRALDGYFYVDLRWKQTERHQKRLLDWETEWAMAALPKKHGSTGRVVMLIDQSGAIFAKDFNTKRFFLYPSHPEQFGWVRLESPDDLVSMQSQRLQAAAKQD